jgi:hypothetical protein
LLFTSNESAPYFCLNVRNVSTSKPASGDQLQIWRPNKLNQNLIGFNLNSNSPDSKLLNNPSHTASTDDSSCSLIKTINFPARLVDISIPKSTLIYKDLIDNRYISNGEQQQILHMIASLQDGSNCFIDLLSYAHISFTHPMAKCILNNSEEDETISSGGGGSKKFRLLSSKSDFILTLDQTFSGLMGVGVTRDAKLVTFRNLNFNKQTIPLVSLYEYHLLTDDHWNLLMSTSPKQVEGLIERLEERYSTQVKSVQRTLFARFHALLWTLYARRAVASPQLNQFRTFDLTIKLIVNKALSIISYATQLTLNAEQVRKLESTAAVNGTSDNNNNNNNGRDAWLSISYVMSNMDSLNQALTPQNETANATFSHFSQIQFKNTLYEFFGDLLEQHGSLRQLQLNDIVQFVLSKKNFELTVNQQLKHLFQFMIDIVLYLTNVIILAKSGSSSGMTTSSSGSSASKSYYGIGLLQDAWFVKEMLKAIMFVKLVFAYSAHLQQHPLQHANNSQLVFHSLPVLPLRSSMQKDLLNDLFNIYVKIYLKITEGVLFVHFTTVISVLN